MATAPRPGGPGTSSNRAAVDDAKQIMTIRVGDHLPVTLAVNLIPLSEKAIVQREMKASFESFYSDESQIGEVSASVLWWLARRANGEPFLTYKQVMEDWPVPFTEKDIEVDVSSPDEGATDPEA